MSKTQIIKRQVNSKTIAEQVVCPNRPDRILKRISILACRDACTRFVGIDNGYVKCGASGGNQMLNLVESNPRLHQILMTYGDNLDYVVGANGKPQT